MTDSIFYKQKEPNIGLITALFLGLFLAFANSGCGKKAAFKAVQTPIGEMHPIEYHVVDAPIHGACYELVEDTLWAENEGDHIDVYNNSDCDHGPAPKGDYCNNVYEQEVCPVGDYLVYPEEAYTELKIHVLRFY